MMYCSEAQRSLQESCETDRTGAREWEAIRTEAYDQDGVSAERDPIVSWMQDLLGGIGEEGTPFSWERRLCPRLAIEHGGDVWGNSQRPPSIFLEAITLSQRNDVWRVAFGQCMLQLRRSIPAKACGIGLEHVTRARGAHKFGIAGHGFGPVGPDPFQRPHAMPHVLMLQETVFLNEFFEELAPGTVSMFRDHRAC